MKRYYDLDNDGKPLTSYARNQPNVSGLLLLEEPEDDNYKWNGSEWVDDVDKFHKSEFEKLGSEISSNLTKLKKPKKVDDAIIKFHEKNDLVYTTRQQVIDAIQEVRDDIF